MAHDFIESSSCRSVRCCFFLPFPIFRLHYVLSRSLWLIFLTNLTRDNGKKWQNIAHVWRVHTEFLLPITRIVPALQIFFRVEFCSTGNATCKGNGEKMKVKEERSTESEREAAAAPMLANMNCNMMNPMVWNTYGNNGSQ